MAYYYVDIENMLADICVASTTHRATLLFIRSCITGHLFAEKVVNSGVWDFILLMRAVRVKKTLMSQVILLAESVILGSLSLLKETPFT